MIMTAIVTKIEIECGGNTVTFSMAEAREVYAALKELFDKPSNMIPWQPYSQPGQLGAGLAEQIKKAQDRGNQINSEMTAKSLLYGDGTV